VFCFEAVRDLACDVPVCWVADAFGSLADAAATDTVMRLHHVTQGLMTRPRNEQPSGSAGLFACVLPRHADADGAPMPPGFTLKAVARVSVVSTTARACQSRGRLTDLARLAQGALVCIAEITPTPAQSEASVWRVGDVILMVNGVVSGARAVALPHRVI
jgi:hypothetical protein